MTARETLKTFFGYDSFRPGQESIIEAIMAGRDSLAIMPTGAGKSICYQVPALMLPGITLVISPLISLMQDQVKALNEAGIHAAFINSSLTETQIGKALSLAAAGAYRIIYVAPERLESYGFTEFANRADISMITVDEAHCISQWGQDFRPSYLKIVDFINNLPQRPIVSAFTATATEEVKEDILCTLRLVNPSVTVTGFDRENLYYSVENIRRKEDFVTDYIEKHPRESGIIYCATRKNVDNLFEVLCKKGVPVTRYHAGLDNDTRKKNQEDFIYDRAPVMVATNAFGMGIDKSNVRYVIHYNMPQSMENYYQEAGRAGRDGEPAQCILLFSAQDIIINKFLLEKKDFSDLDTEDVELVKQRDMRRLQIMEGYCRTTGCLRNTILNYFGEKTSNPCDNCGNCHREYREVDMTAEAKQIINCVAETKGRYGLTIVLGTLMGADRARLRELGTVNYRSYGVLKDRNETLLRSLISQLIEEGYLYQTEEQYSVLKMGDISRLRDENTRVIMRIYEEKEPDRRRASRKRSTDALTAAGYDLFEELRKLRLEMAREEGLPPYIIFNDKTLIDMCIKLPETVDDLLTVSGVGKSKSEKYGDRFLNAIAAFVEAHPGAVISMQSQDSQMGNGGSGNEDEDGKLNAAGTSGSKTSRTKKKKRSAFYLAEKDAEEFQYQDMYYISEIKNELNRICTVTGVKKATLGQIWEYLVSQGLTCEDGTGGVFVKKPTTQGLEYGILLEEKVSSSGVPYKLMKYPPKVQKMIVEHLVGPRAEEESGDSSVESAEKEEAKVFDRAEYNRSKNRPDGAGAAWSEEEDARLDQEYESGMKIPEIARRHSRTSGGIRARLKRHGLIE
ncbi:MAG: DNA helicase RecQ [Lachnospiraceae bacterium]|nr:DNA helicase RecQ [Lachnospiraceae bacterium]